MATAVFTRRLNPALSVVLFEGARQPGAKILVSGGSRCNVTNTAVSEHDFWGGRRSIIRKVLRALTVDETVAFFRDLGVALHEERDGKLFPDSNRSRDVLAALLGEVSACGATLLAGHRVQRIEPIARGFEIDTTQGTLTASRVVLATGGRSLPKSGSDGAGYTFAERLGHSIVATTPGLVPLTLARRSAVSRRALGRLASRGARGVDRRPDRRAAHGQPALDALRHQRSGGAGRVAPLAAGAGRGPRRRDQRQFLPGPHVRRSRSTSHVDRAIAPADGSRNGARHRRRSDPIAAGVRGAGGAARPPDRRRQAAVAARARRSPRCWCARSPSGRCRSADARLQLCGSHGGRRRPCGDRSVDDGIARVSGRVSGGRGAGRRRPDRRVQLPVGVVERPRGGARAHS